MIQQYTLTGRLETGELAELYRAQRAGASPVVIKLFHPRTSDVGYAQAVAETARLLNGVDHPGVSHVLEIGLVRHRLAVVREDTGRFNLGTALQRLNTKEVLLAPALALTWVIDLLELVHQAHLAGVIHGALTPGNVMLTAEGRPAVCDFGALQALNAAPALRKTFGARGRNNYRAPELAQAETFSIQSDLYSLGAITYELLTLREPGKGAQATVSTRRENVPPPSRLDRRINSRLDPIVLRAIDYAPTRRFKSCADFAGALRDFLSNNGGLPQKEDLRRFTQELFPREVNPDAMGPVPFDDPFALKEVDGAELEQTDERSLVLAARKAFSGGEVSEFAETNVGLPVFAESELQASVQPDRRETIEVPQARDRSELSWDAPPSAAPVARKATEGAQANAVAVQKRMRMAQDFEPTDRTDPTVAALVDDTLPIATAPRKPPPATLVEIPSYAATPGDSQPLDQPLVRDSDGKLRRMITEERSLASTRQRQARMMALAGSFMIVGFLIFGVTVWLRGQGMIGGQVRRPVEPPPPPPRLADRPVDRPVDRPIERANPPPRPVLPPGPRPDCYDAPSKKGAALLTVAFKSPIKVDLDGQRLCTLNSVAVTPGPHTVLITDTKTGVKEEHKLRFVAGANTKLEAFLRPR